MAELSTLSLGDFVALAETIWQRAVEGLDTPARSSGIFKVIPIPANSGNTRQFSEIDANQYLSYKAEGDQAQRGSVQQGYSVTMTVNRYGENIGISYEMRTQNKYPEVVQRLTAAARKGANSVDLDLSHLLGFGTATTYTDRDGRTRTISTGDGLALWSTAHTLNGSASTYRARLANNPQLSRGALEGMEQLFVDNAYNQLGEKVAIMPDILWTTDDPNTVNVARENLQSTASPDAGHEGVINPYRGKYRHVILPREATTALGAPDTAKRRHWGLVSSEHTSAMLGVWEEPHVIPPSEGSNAEDVQTDDWDFRTRTGYGIAVLSAIGLRFSSGDNVA